MSDQIRGKEGAPNDDKSDRLLAGAEYESRLIVLIYVLDEGAKSTDFPICEAGPGLPGDLLEQSRACINELFEAVEIEPKAWVDSLIESTAPIGRRQRQISLSDQTSKKFKLEGLSIGEYFTNAAYYALPIESCGGDMDIVMNFGLQSGYTLRLRATGSAEFIYPKGEDEDDDQESVLEYGITFTAEFIKASTD